MSDFIQAVQDPMVAPIVLAASAGAVAYVASRVVPLVSKALALAASVLVLLLGVGILRGPAGLTFSRTCFDLGENFTLSVDLARTPLGMIVVIGSAGFALLITLYSFRAMAGHRHEGKFYAYLIWALAGSVVVGLAGNLLVLLVGWEIVTLMLFLMVNQGRGDAAGGAAKAYCILGFTDACLLLAVALLIGYGGSEKLSLTAGPVAVGSMGATGYVVYVLIMAAALAKAGAIPLHTWIPAIAPHAPTPVMAYLPAALDKLLGIYLLAVLALRMFTPDPTMQTVMMIVGATTIIAAVFMAMMQHNLKRLLSFHAVSQVGYMVLGIGTGTTIGVIGGLFHMINHAIYKSNLFLMSGTVGRAVGSDEIEDMGGLGRRLPVTFACGAVAAAAISGVPPFNGFASKWLVYQGTLALRSGLGMALLVVAVFGSALTLASFVKVIYSAFLSPAPAGATYPGKAKESFWLAAPMVVLAVACIVLGIAPGLATEGILRGAIAGASTSGPDISAAPGQIGTTLGLWGPTQATGLILLGIVLGVVLLWLASMPGKVRVVRPFLGGEVPGPDDDRFRVPGTHFYQTVDQMPGIGPLLKQGEGGAMDPYHWCVRYGGGLVEWLRGLHSGLISVYVAWSLAGLTAILVYLLVAGR